MARNQSGRRKVVVIVRERGGNPVPRSFQFGKPGCFIRSRFYREGTAVHADQAASWDNLHERFEIKRINHPEAYSLDGACTDMAEEYASRLYGTGIGIRRHVTGSNFIRYAQESSWREDSVV